MINKLKNSYLSKTMSRPKFLFLFHFVGIRFLSCKVLLVDHLHISSVVVSEVLPGSSSETGRWSLSVGIPICCSRCQYYFHAHSDAWSRSRFVRFVSFALHNCFFIIHLKVCFLIFIFSPHKHQKTCWDAWLS